MRKLLAIGIVGSFLFGCGPDSGSDVALLPAPQFNADSAYASIQKQVNFGPRIPTSEAHDQCGDYLVRTLTRLGATVVEQKDSVISYDGTLFPLRNIIASFYPDQQKRILLAGNWDTRAWADRSDTRATLPSVGANNSASEVAVLLEIARLVGQNTPPIGIDILLFDMDDQDRPAFDINPHETEHFGALGARYWANNLTGYTAEYGILLNMVGAENAKFTLEGNSMKYAESVIRKVWDIGNTLGYAAYFRYNRTPYIQDSHAYIQEITGIPTIDIIHYDPNGIGPFWEHWHTHGDTMEVIDRATLAAVGQTLVQVIYNENAE